MLLAVVCVCQKLLEFTRPPLLVRRELLRECFHDREDRTAVLLCLLGIVGLFERVSEVTRPDGLQHLVPLSLILDLEQFHVVGYRSAPAFCLLQLIPIQLAELQPSIDGAPRESGRLCDGVHTFAQVEHVLKAVGLLDGRKV